MVPNPQETVMVVIPAFGADIKRKMVLSPKTVHVYWQNSKLKHVFISNLIPGKFNSVYIHLLFDPI